MVQNKALIYKKLPTGKPVAGEHLAVETREFDLNQPIPEGGAIVRGLYFSLDPYMRGRMRDPSIKSYVAPFTIDEPIAAYGLVQIVAPGKNFTKYAKGDVVHGIHQVSEYSLTTAADYALPIGEKIEITPGIPGSHYVSILGMTGLTAYSSLYEIGQPKKGETIFISSAAGAVGQIVGQIAKREGLRVIGSVGDDAKLDFIINELGFDGGWNYKKEKPWDALKRLAPDGVDIYYENVGGEQLAAALDQMNVHGRIIASGMISQYSLPADQRYGIQNLYLIVTKRIRIQGFLVNDKDFGPKYGKERNERVSQWLLEGSIKCKEDIGNGIDAAAESFVSMLEGKNFGKALVKVADPE